MAKASLIVPPRPSFVSGSIKALISTSILVVVSLLTLLALFGPTLLLNRQFRGSKDHLKILVISTIIVHIIQLCIAYTTLLGPLLKASRQGSSFAKRCASIYAMRSCQVFISLLCSGPLYLFFFGRDPFFIIQKLNTVTRNLEAKILRVGPPRFRISETARHFVIPLRDGVETAATLYSPLLANGHWMIHLVPSFWCELRTIETVWHHGVLDLPNEVIILWLKIHVDDLVPRVISFPCYMKHKMVLVLYMD